MEVLRGMQEAFDKDEVVATTWQLKAVNKGNITIHLQHVNLLPSLS